MDTNTAYAPSTSPSFVRLRWSHSFHTFSSQKQGAYEHSAAGGITEERSRLSAEVSGGGCCCCCMRGLPGGGALPLPLLLEVDGLGLLAPPPWVGLA